MPSITNAKNALKIFQFFKTYLTLLDVVGHLLKFVGTYFKSYSISKFVVPTSHPGYPALQIKVKH